MWVGARWCAVKAGRCRGCAATAVGSRVGRRPWTGASRMSAMVSTSSPSWRTPGGQADVLDLDGRAVPVEHELEPAAEPLGLQLRQGLGEFPAVDVRDEAAALDRRDERLERHRLVGLDALYLLDRRARPAATVDGEADRLRAVAGVDDGEVRHHRVARPGAVVRARFGPTSGGGRPNSTRSSPTRRRAPSVSTWSGPGSGVSAPLFGPCVSILPASPIAPGLAGTVDYRPISG
jgi:hypothetical protein